MSKQRVPVGRELAMDRIEQELFLIETQLAELQKMLEQQSMPLAAHVAVHGSIATTRASLSKIEGAVIALADLTPKEAVAVRHAG